MSRPTSMDALGVAVRLLDQAGEALDYAGKLGLAKEAWHLQDAVVAERRKWETPASKERGR